jgi:hypothetical protein
MDPVTLAIVTAVSAGAMGGATDVAKNTIVDSYEGLKALIKKKFGHDSDVSQAIEKLQVKPDSLGHRAVLGEELANANAGSDPEVLSAAQSLIALVKALPQGEQRLQQIANGVGIAQASGSGAATVNVSGWPGSAKKE